MDVARVVITGVGMMTPVGVGRDASWLAMLEGQNGIGPITLVEAEDLPARIGGEVSGFEATDFLNRKDARRMDRFVHLAVAATDEALEQSGLDVPAEADQIGCMIGSGIGGGSQAQPIRGRWLNIRI